jgi:hypothetical protein
MASIVKTVNFSLTCIKICYSSDWAVKTYQAKAPRTSSLVAQQILEKHASCLHVDLAKLNPIKPKMKKSVVINSKTGPPEFNFWVHLQKVPMVGCSAPCTILVSSSVHCCLPICPFQDPSENL